MLCGGGMNVHLTFVSTQQTFVFTRSNPIRVCGYVAVQFRMSSWDFLALPLVNLSEQIGYADGFN